MAKLIAPLLSIKAWGTLAGILTFRRRIRQAIAEKKPIPRDAKTAIQLVQRLLFQDAVAWWHALTEVEKQAYDKPGREHHMSGYAWFIRSYLLNPPAATFLALTDVPDTYVGEAGHFPLVNAGEDALEWGTIKEYPSGIVDIPSQSAARVYLSTTAQVIPTGSWEKVEFNAKTYDQQTEFSLAPNHRFTPTQAGLYLIFSCCLMQQLGDGINYAIQIKKNGAALAKCFRNGGQQRDYSNSVMDVVKLAIGEYIEIFVWHNQGVDRNLLATESYTFATFAKLA